MRYSVHPRELLSFALLLLLPMLLPMVGWAESPINAAVAPLYVGQERIVEGQVSAAGREGNVVTLEIGEDPYPLRVRLVIGLLSRFPPRPEVHYLGQRIRVAGRITDFRGQAEIIIRDPDHIVLAGRLPSPAAGPGPEVENLGARVRMLEDRIRELERAAEEKSGTTHSESGADGP